MSFDALTIGAGHNGLVAATYLARAGRTVCVVEVRPVVGGACVTEELVPGAQWSSCSFIQGMLRPEVPEELELAKFGLRSVAPKIQGFGLWEDGDHVMLHQDVDATLKSIQRHSAPDAKGFFEFGARLKRFADLTRDWLLSDPTSRSQVFARFETVGETDLLNEFMVMAAGDMLDRYITSDRLKGYMFSSAWSRPMAGRKHPVPRTSMVITRWVNSTVSSAAGACRRMAWARSPSPCVAAPSILAPWFVPAARSRRSSSSPAATGVRLAGGEVISAQNVISNAEPGRTLRVLPKGTLSRDHEATMFDPDGLDRRHPLQKRSFSRQFLRSRQATL